MIDQGDSTALQQHVEILKIYFNQLHMLQKNIFLELLGENESHNKTYHKWFMLEHKQLLRTERKSLENWDDIIKSKHCKVISLFPTPLIFL